MKKIFFEFILVLGPPEPPDISENPGVLCDGSQASLHHDTTKNIDLCGPDVKIRSEELFFVNSHGKHATRLFTCTRKQPRNMATEIQFFFLIETENWACTVNFTRYDHLLA